MKLSILSVVVSAVLPSLALAQAQKCQDLSGEYINIKDAGYINSRYNGRVSLTQDGCKSITMTDNSGKKWVFNLDGSPTQPPAGLNTSLTGTYTATLDSPNSVVGGIILKAKARGTAVGVNFDVQYEAEAFPSLAINRSLYGDDAFHIEKIALRTQSLKVSSVGGNGIGETSAFMQGANWVLDLGKGAVDAELIPVLKIQAKPEQKKSWFKDWFQ